MLGEGEHAQGGRSSSSRLNIRIPHWKSPWGCPNPISIQAVVAEILREEGSRDSLYSVPMCVSTKALSQTDSTPKIMEGLLSSHSLKP